MVHTIVHVVDGQLKLESQSSVAQMFFLKMKVGSLLASLVVGRCLTCLLLLVDIGRSGRLLPLPSRNRACRAATWLSASSICHDGVPRSW